MMRQDFSWIFQLRWGFLLFVFAIIVLFAFSRSYRVDRHPEFRNSRCLFVVRTDGGWIDFSYQKCLRAYIREKYPQYAERFIREHYKRGNR